MVVVLLILNAIAFTGICDRDRGSIPRCLIFRIVFCASSTMAMKYATVTVRSLAINYYT